MNIWDILPVYFALPVHYICYNQDDMGRYIQQNESRSELQQRLDAELRAKAAAKAKAEGGEGGGAYAAPDGVDDAEYLRGTKATTTLAPAWVAILIAVIVIFGVFVYQMSR